MDESKFQNTGMQPQQSGVNTLSLPSDVNVAQRGTDITNILEINVDAIQRLCYMVERAESMADRLGGHVPESAAAPEDPGDTSSDSIIGRLRGQQEAYAELANRLQSALERLERSV